MNDLYADLCDRVDDLKAKNVVPDKVVVPGDEWRDVKSQATVLDGEGFAGGDKTLVQGVHAVWNDRVTGAEIIIEVDADE